MVFGWTLLLTLAACGQKDDQLAQIPQHTTPVSTTNDMNSPIPITPNPPEAKGNASTPESLKIKLNDSSKPTLKDFGLSEYPNKNTTNQDSKSSFKQDGRNSEANLTFSTKDSPSKVTDFYSSQISSNKSKSVTSSTGVVGGLTSTGAKVYIVATKIGDKTLVSIDARFAR
jgi:hypothetical protein